MIVAGRRILGGVDLDLDLGGLTVIVGPNGAGKTSLLRLASGDATPAFGRVAWKGVDTADLPIWRRAALTAVMSQSTEIGFAFTVAETIALGISWRVDGGRSSRRRRRAPTSAISSPATCDRCRAANANGCSSPAPCSSRNPCRASICRIRSP
nr:ATP-binding cassette domain-containing protein [Pinisolibacter aquiterrae]